MDSGLCECGCGQQAPIAPFTYKRFGWVNGKPLRFIRGHCNRGRHIKPVRYLVEDRGYATPCWIWQLQIQANGYGSVSVNRKPYRAHRFYWEQVNGPVPDGLVLDHLCRVRECVNPEHLEVVTHPENVRRAPSTKLTEADVRAIRSMIDEGVKQVDIARQFGVAQQTICNIKKRRRWADVL